MLPSLRLFNDFFPDYWSLRTPIWSDWEEKKGELVLSVTLPGYEKEDFEVYSENGGLNLSIKGKERQLFYSIIDSLYTSLYDMKSAKATYRRGILKITIPKLPGNERKVIPVEVS